MNPAMFKYQVQQAQKAYAKSKNFDDYIADVAYIAVSTCASQLAESNPKLAHLSNAVMVSQHGIKSLAKLVAERLSCPIEKDQDHEDFAKHFCNNAKHFVNRDLQSAWDTIDAVLKQLRL